MGWGFVSALAAHHDLWVIVEEEKFRSEIERGLRQHPELAAAIRFVFVRKRRNRILRRFWPPSYYWYYRSWHKSALRVAQQLHSQVRFDVAHQLTMVGFREPGYLWRLGIPFVWGPVGGMGVFPWRFLGRVGVYGAAFYAAYNVYNLLHMRVLRRPRLAARAAGKGLITATQENRTAALRHWGCASDAISEVGLPCAPAAAPTPRPRSAPLQLVWAGQHVPGKALNLTLEALARLPADVNWILHVLGQGRETVRWQRLAARLSISGRCRFHGWVERSKALDLMRSAHVMVVSSLRDLTSTVIVEGLACGLAVVCPDHCGFSDAVDDSCGIKVPVRDPETLIAGMARAVERLARDEELRVQLARGGLRRAAAYAWPAKAAQVDAAYRRVIGARYRVAGMST